MLTLCVIGGLYLLIQGPLFYLPSRWNPHEGHLFGPLSSRLLGAGLLVTAWAGRLYFQNFYYREKRLSLPPSTQSRYFLCILLALILITAAFINARSI